MNSRKDPRGCRDASSGNPESWRRRPRPLRTSPTAAGTAAGTHPHSRPEGFSRGPGPPSTAEPRARAPYLVSALRDPSPPPPPPPAPHPQPPRTRPLIRRRQRLADASANRSFAFAVPPPIRACRGRGFSKVIPSPPGAPRSLLFGRARLGLSSRHFRKEVHSSDRLECGLALSPAKVQQLSTSWEPERRGPGNTLWCPNWDFIHNVNKASEF
ncbi:hypothetical protein NN561_008889 [Cricetulus griseus]